MANANCRTEKLLEVPLAVLESGARAASAETFGLAGDSDFSPPPYEFPLCVPPVVLVTTVVTSKNAVVTAETLGIDLDKGSD